MGVAELRPARSRGTGGPISRHDSKSRVMVGQPGRLWGVSVSLFSFFAVAFCVVAVLVFAAGRNLWRRLRHPQTVKGVTAAVAAVVVPLNVYSAFAHPIGTGSGALLRSAIMTTNLAALSRARPPVPRKSNRTDSGPPSPSGPGHRCAPGRHRARLWRHPGEVPRLRPRGPRARHDERRTRWRQLGPAG